MLWAADPPPPQPATRNASSAKTAQELRAEKGWQTTEETAAGEGRVLRVFADSFPAWPFLSGSQPGALDLLAAVVSKWSGARAHLAASRPDFSALLQAIEREPRLAPVFDRYWPPS
jgi:glutathione S-transferase